MKKLLLSALALTLALSVTACGGKDEAPEATPTPEPTPIATEAPEATEAPVETEAPAENEATGETVGSTLLGVFNELVADEAAGHDALTIADKLVTHESILFSGGAMEIEEGFLSGFDNYEVTGFEQGAMFAPMMGSIPFVGYIFTLPEDADIDAFMTGLKDNANLRWQICVEADEMICEANGNTVFFLMCPTTFEQ
ncbi:MAG: hypothetical protein IJZ82_10575 [Lachnospiraceae bacterium]|nr:hypothetical protein [Lachnospiraceae bacterium]